MSFLYPFGPRAVALCNVCNLPVSSWNPIYTYRSYPPKTGGPMIWRYPFTGTSRAKYFSTEHVKHIEIIFPIRSVSSTHVSFCCISSRRFRVCIFWGHAVLGSSERPPFRLYLVSEYTCALTLLRLHFAGRGGAFCVCLVLGYVCFLQCLLHGLRAVFCMALALCSTWP